ncbi:probable inactive receptor kinase At1g48480 [Euphorbia lathyris]|uniref:probable inactive receptor kinase At1g48480 n=1 Tax=Euphorbia lathyris TaxID=212925 RepID=UPI00331351EC
MSTRKRVSQSPSPLNVQASGQIPDRNWNFLSLPADGHSLVAYNLASDRTALLALRLALGGRFLRWNISDETPCNWSGVICQANRVVQLRLPGMALSGELPVAIGNLIELRSLSLQFNAFSGSIPDEIESG